MSSNSVALVSGLIFVRSKNAVVINDDKLNLNGVHLCPINFKVRVATMDFDTIHGKSLVVNVFTLMHVI